MSNPEDIMKEVEQILTEFGECTELIRDINILSLPFPLQVKLLNEYTRLTAAIKSYNTTIKEVVVIDAMLKNN